MMKFGSAFADWKHLRGQLKQGRIVPNSTLRRSHLFLELRVACGPLSSRKIELLKGQSEEHRQKRISGWMPDALSAEIVHHGQSLATYPRKRRQPRYSSAKFPQQVPGRL